MSGIFGAVGFEDGVQQIVRGLTALEYRGYDSSGVAWRTREAELRVARSVGHVAVLKEELAARGSPRAAGAAIGHTRWATHGKVTQSNAHPHIDCAGTLAVVHNGVLENHAALREVLVDDGHTVRSETDSEVIAHLLEHAEDGDLANALRLVMGIVDGSLAVCVLEARAGPARLLVARRDSPLVIGLGPEGALVSSDPVALLGRADRVVYLEDGAVAWVHPTGVDMRREDGSRLWTSGVPLVGKAQEVRLGGYPHLMRKEIDEQPASVARVTAGRVPRYGPLLLNELDELYDGFLPRRVVFIACGSSRYASLAASYALERAVGVPSHVEIASELRHRRAALDDETLAVVVSQSGETADTIGAMRVIGAAGARVLAITNVAGSTISRDAHACFHVRAGEEFGVASTKAFTAQLVALRLVALDLAERFGRLQLVARDQERAALLELPERLALLLDDPTALEQVSARLSESRLVLFVGRDQCYPVALDGALKLKRISYVPAEAHAAGEMEHGPIALVDQAVPALVVVPPGPLRPEVERAIAELRARGGFVCALYADDEPVPAADVALAVPGGAPETFPVLVSAALQLIAYNVAALLGRSIDRPRNLARSVTVE